MDRDRKAPSAPRPAVAILAALVLAGAPGCGREEILHGLDERQANQVLVALDEGGLRGAKRRDDGAEGRWLVEVAGADTGRAQRLLAERELPRPETPGFASVFGKGSVVPTPGEDRARLLQALAGELSRSVEAMEGVVEARVHVALPPEEPLRAAPAARGSVLVKVRAGARDRVEGLVPGIQALVAGAVPGLDAARVAVVLCEGAPSVRAEPARRGPSPVLLGVAAAAAGLALLLLVPRFGRLRIPRVKLRWPA